MINKDLDMERANILIYDNTKKKSLNINSFFKNHDYLSVHSCSDLETAHQYLQEKNIDILIIDPLAKNDHPQTDLEILQMCNLLQETKVIGIIKSITETVYQQTNRNKIDHVITTPINEKKLFSALSRFVHLIQI